MSSADLPGEAAEMPAARIPAALLTVGILAGLLGAALAFAASNFWFYSFGAHVIPGIQGRTLMPDFFTYLLIDAFVGAGCGYAGRLTGQNIGDLWSSRSRPSRLIPALYTVVLATTMTLIVNAVLLFMSYL